MTLEIPRQEWSRFFNDLSQRRFEWRTKVEVMSNTIGSQILSKNLPLVGVTFEEKNGADVIEIAVGEDSAQHQTHNVINPSKVAYLKTDEFPGGVLEIEENNGTKTLIHLIEPMPMIIGYSEFEVISTAA